MSKANLKALVRFRIEQSEESLRGALLLREQKAMGRLSTGGKPPEPWAR